MRPAISSTVSTLFSGSQNVTDRAYERYLHVGNILGINTTTEQEENSPLRWLLKRCIHYSSTKNKTQMVKSDGRTLSWRLWEIKCPKLTIPVCFQPQIPRTLKFLSSTKIQRAKWPGMQLTFLIQPYSQMPQIQISVKGTEKVLKSLNPNKAAGPDQFKPIGLLTLHAELAPILQVIFQKSLDSGKLPHILKEANVSPIFKKRRQVRPCKLSRDISHMRFVQSAWTHSLTWLNTWLIPKYYLSCNTGSGRRGPARPSW